MMETSEERALRERRNRRIREEIVSQNHAEVIARAAAARSVSPDKAAEAQRAARALKVPYEVAEFMDQEALEEIRVRGIVDTIQKNAMLAIPFADPYMSNIADGDNAEMVRLSTAAQSRPQKRYLPQELSWLENTGRALGAGVAGGAATLSNAFYAAGDAADALLYPIDAGIASVVNLYSNAIGQGNWLNPDEARNAARVGAETRAASTEQVVTSIRPKVDNWLAKNLLAGVESVPLTLAAAATRNPTAGAGLIAGGVAGDNYFVAKEEGLNPFRAAVYGVTQGLPEFIFERAPLFNLLNDRGGSFGTMIVNQLKTEIPGEQATTFLQDLTEWATLNPEKTLQEFVAERPSRAAETLVQTIAGVGATTSVIAGLDKAARRFAKVQTAAEDAVTLDTIMDSAAKHKMRERDPEAFQQYVDSQTEGTGSENVYLPIEAVDTLFQSENVDEDVQAFFEQYQDQIEEARATGGDVVIPTSAIAARLAGTPAWEALKQDARLDAGGFSPREMEQEQKDAEQILEQRGEEIATAALDEIAANAPAVQVFEEVKAQLEAAGFTPDVATKQASIYAANREAWGARLGMTALEYHQQNPVQFERAGLAPDTGDAARVMDQSGFARRNPNATAVNNLVDRSEEGRLRGIMDPKTGDVFWWDAYEKTHAQAAKELGLDEWAGGKDHRLYATKREDGAVEFSMGNDSIAPSFRRLAERDPDGDTFRFGAFLGTWNSDDFLEQLNEYEGVNPDVTMNQASRYDERFGDNPITVSDRFGDPSTLLQHDDWAILTAENPRGEQADEVTNARAMRDLEADLQAMGLVYTRAIGKYGQIENSFAVVGITQAEAEMLGRKYDQDSVLTRQGLTYQDGSVNPVTGSVDVFEDRPDDFFTEIPELGVQFAVGIDFDHKIAPVSAETVKVLALDAVSPEVRSRIWADTESKNIRLAADGSLLVGVDKQYLTDARYQERLAPYGARAVLEGSPEFESATPTQFDAPPVNEDGTITLQHFSTSDELQVTDPTRWGESGAFLPKSERAGLGSAPARTYFGIATEQPGGYINEFGEGRFRYEAKIDASLLYDIGADPQNLKSEGNFENAVAAAGYAGYWAKDPTLGLVAVVFNPLEVAPAVRTLFQSENPIFYSALARAIENSKQAKAPAAQWKGVLQNAPGVKEDEIGWTGLIEALDFDPKAVLTREQLAAVVEAGGIKIEEVVLGAPPIEQIDGKFWVRFGPEGMVRAFDSREEANAFAADNGVPTQFVNWSSDPSNSTYKEILLTLPIGQGGNPSRAPSTHWDQPAVVAHVRFMDKEDVDGNRVLFVEEVQSDWHQKGRDQGYETPVDPKAVEAAEKKVTDALDAWYAVMDEFIATPAGDLIAPLTADRMWDGSTDRFLKGERAIVQRVVTGDINGAEGVRDAFGPFENYLVWKNRYQDARNAYHLAARELEVAKGIITNGGVPNAPFKTSWPALVMKRVIKYAVDGGYDKVAWTTGEQQADRYSLAEATGPLTFIAPVVEGNAYRVRMSALAAGRLAENNLGEQTNDYGSGKMTLRMTEAQMTEAFGADITKRGIEGAIAYAERENDLIAAADAEYSRAEKAYTDLLAEQLAADVPDTAAVEAARRESAAAARALEAVQAGGFILEGEDLKIGGEGMKAFYDRNLVNITNGLVKKAGAKVGPVRIPKPRMAELARTANELRADAEALAGSDDRLAEGLFDRANEIDADKGKSELQPGFEITDALRDQASGGFPLFQKTGKPRGQIAMYTDKMVITLFEDADLSTLLHETGHLFVEELARNAQRPNAPVDVKADWAAMKKWLKQNGHTVRGATIPREAHELMARGFERYLMEGRAPSKNLEGVFGTFRAWLVRIYQNVQRLASPITPEIREVFDRLLATQQAIDAYREEQNARPLFADKPADMTQAEFDTYRESVLASRDEAQARLTKKVMEDIRKRENKRYRSAARAARDDVIEELNTDPRFVALHLLRTGRWLGGGDRDQFPVKIDRDWFVSNYGVTALDRLPKGPFLVKKDGDEADFIAEMAGFPSGAAMIDALFEMGDQQVQMRADGDRRSLFDREVDERVKAVLEANGTADALSPDQMEEEAQAAVENERQGDLLSAELRYLSRGTGQTPTPYRLARAWAERKIRAGTVQAVASRSAVQQYARAAAKAGRLAEEALIAGDTNETYRQKQAQLINHALHMEAKIAADKVDAIVARMKRLGKRAAMKSVDQDYMDRVHGLLEGFDFRKKSKKFLEEQQGFIEWAAGQAALGYEVQVPPRLMLNGTPYTRASVEELYGLDDAVKALLHLGKLKQGILDGREERAFNDLVDEMVGNIKDLPDRKLTTEINEDDRIGASIASFLIKIETLADDLDGGNPNGPFNRLLTQRVNEQENLRAALRDRTLEPISKAYLEMAAADRKRLEEKITIPQFRHKGGELDPRNGEPVTMTRMELLAVALNTGNLSNLEKMSKGEGWDAGDIMTVLRNELTKSDWDFVQSVWDSLATLWPDIAATERRLSGVVPEQVEITPIDTPFGTYRGGYYPVVYDPARSQRAENNAVDAANDLFGMKSGVNTPKGHTITRTEATGPILRSVEAVLFTHVEKVITRIAYAEYARDVLRTIDNPRVRNAIDLKLGREYRKQIRPWLQRVVNAASVDQRGLNWAERFLRSARVNMSLVAMGFRVSTGIAQIGGWNQASGRIGPRYLALGMKTLLRDRGDALRFVFDRSPEMERRNNEVNRDVADAMKMMRNKDGWVNKARVMAFWHIGMVDRYIVAVPTWLGAHAKGIAEGMTDKEASFYADKMVRTSQGNGAEKDLANWQSPNSEAMRSLTLFYTIFNVQLNAQWESVRAVKKGNYMKATVLSFWFLTAAPLVDALLSGDMPDADDDEDTWANWFFRNIFFNMFSGVPLVRDMASYGERKMAGQYATVGTTPVIRAEEALKKAGTLAIKAAQGEELPDTTVKTMIETPGYFLGLPTGQPAATAQFLWDYTNGDTNPEGLTDWFKGLTKGKVPEDE